MILLFVGIKKSNQGIIKIHIEYNLLTIKRKYDIINIQNVFFVGGKRYVL